MISFAEFVLRYLDSWNVQAGYLAEDLNVNLHTLNDWLHRGQIPNLENIEVIENYFEEDIKGVVFDGKKFQRRYKVIRPDGTSQIYPTLQSIVCDEGVAYVTMIRCLMEDDVVKSGKSKGYRFERAYLEDE